MFSFLLLPFIYGVPPYSILFVCSELYSYQIKQFEKFVDLLNNNVNKLCKKLKSDSDDVKNCKNFYKFLENAQFSTGNDINGKIQKISKYTEFLFILCDGKIESMDLGKLKSNCAVFISYETDIYQSYQINEFNFNIIQNFTMNTIKAIHKITRSSYCKRSRSLHLLSEKMFDGIDPSNYQSSDSSIMNVSIIGNLNNKVSFLSISKINLKVTNSELNIHSLYLDDSEIDQNSKDIRSVFLIFTINSHMRRYGTVFDKIHTDQYGLDMTDSYDSKMVIIFTDWLWAVGSYKNNLPEYLYLVHYQLAKTFNLITNIKTFYFYPNNTNIGEKKFVNLTITHNSFRTTLSKKRKSNLNDIEIIPIGNWSGVDFKPKVSLNYDINKYRLMIKNDVKSLFSIDEPQNIFSYVPKNMRVRNEQKIGIICAIAFILIMIIIFIIISIIYRPKKESSDEDNSFDDYI